MKKYACIIIPFFFFLTGVTFPFPLSYNLVLKLTHKLEKKKYPELLKIKNKFPNKLQKKKSKFNLED